MGARARPIPPELWQRLAALDARCDFDLRRQDANQPSEKHNSRFNYQRQWIVKIDQPRRPRVPDRQPPLQQRYAFCDPPACLCRHHADRFRSNVTGTQPSGRAGDRL